MWMVKGNKNVIRRVISEASAVRISGRLTSIGKAWPRDFSRKPRSLHDLKRWKGTEYRQFILYLAPAVLRGSLLQTAYFNLFLILHVAITLLSREEMRGEDVRCARSLLKNFVTRAKRLMGTEFISYNVHNLIHLPDDCERFGKIDNFSAFPFENELQVLKLAIRGKTKPLHQLVGRFQERSRELRMKPRTLTVSDGTMSCVHTKGPLCGLSGVMYSKLHWRHKVCSLLSGDNMAILTDETVIAIRNFVTTHDNKKYVLGQEFLSYTDAYSDPIPSSALGIYLVEKLCDRIKKWPVQEIKCKAIAVQYCGSSRSFVVYPCL